VGALLLVGLLFLLIGAAVAIGGIVSVVKQKRRTARGVTATGRVVELVKTVLNPGSAGIYCPVVEFTTGAGQPVRFQSDYGTMPASHTVGQAVGVRYDPANPQLAALDSATANWFVPGCTIAMGLLFLVMGAVFVTIGAVVMAGGHGP
jgi:hypothetical protein